MKFFVPRAKTPEKAEQIYEATKKFAEHTLGWEISERRIFRIEYWHNGKEHVAEVGAITNVNGEEVMVILKSNAFLVCTPNRGVLRGEPILVGTDEVRLVEDFDE
jgi:allophanate hydrolase subunit 1